MVERCRRRTALVLSSIVLALAQLAGCASVANRTPAEVVARVAKDSDLRITWFGPESENILFGFPVIERELEPILEKCKLQQGAPFSVRQSLRFAGPSLKRGGTGEKPEFTRIVTTEIHCKQAETTLWAARINYGDHRFYSDIQNRERIQLRLRTSYLSAEALAPRPLDEETKRRRAEAEAAARAANERYETDLRQKAEAKRLADERRQAYQAQLAAERPAFRAALQVGSRVRWLDHFTEPTQEPARGLVVELKRPLALVQFDVPTGGRATTTQTRWVTIDELAQPE